MKNKKSLIYFILITIWSLPLFASRENYVPIDQAGQLKLIFDKTAFDNSTYNFFVGAKQYPAITSPSVQNTVFDAKEYAITRSEGPDIFGITPAEAFVPNGAGDALEKKANDLYGAVILNLGLFNSYPVVSYRQDLTPGAENDSNTAYLITAPKDGKSNIKTVALIDAATGPTKQIKAITGSDKYVFAAVSATGKDWEEPGIDGNNRGIAVLKTVLNIKVPTITQISPTDLSNDKATTINALKVNVTNSTPTATDPRLVYFSDRVGALATEKANLGAEVDMYWDTELKRLFIGLSGVKRADQNIEGGCFNVLLGRIDQETVKDVATDKTFVLAPILNTPTKDKLYSPTDANYQNTNKFMVGFYFDGTNPSGNQNITISAKKVRVMHTSTGKSYLIVNCNVTNANYNQVSALPLIGRTKADGKTAQTKELIGTLASTADFYKSPSTPAEMPQNEQPAVKVGDATLSTENLTDLFVHGDSVFMCLNGVTPQTSGIFQSTALFNANGIITNWTPWQRVMGDVQKVQGCGIDAFSNFYFLSTKDTTKTDFNTIRFTTWGTTEAVNLEEVIDSKTGNAGWTSVTPSRNLSSLLAKIFPQEQGGVFQIINFDENTPGFNAKFSMMVAIGYDKVALIQTMDPTTQTPITNFVENTNVFVLNDQALKDIAPLCFAEVARNTTGDTGWLFVGGYNGVAVLSKADGTGWNSTTGNGLVNLGTNPANFPSAYTFKKLSSANFKNIRKLASLVSNDLVGDTKKLFIQTMDSLYTIDQTAAQFLAGNMTTEKKITLGTLPATVKFADLLIIPNSDTFNNTEYAKFKFLFGSTNGLLVGSGYDGNTAITLLNNGSATNDPALHLHYISKTKGKNSTTGNLYALSANYVKNTGKVRRYTVDGSKLLPQLADACKQISVDSDPFIDLYNFRGNFITDGAFGFSMIAKGNANNLLTDLYQITQNQKETGPLDDLLDLNDSNWYIGVMTRNTASGSWLVPGDWGVKVNE